ncbi:MAG TPA: SpoIIE family protein phosphatase [Candidatus Acidoferrales bacterium]|jgi:phosphoserine phosphatase RsbU/P
MPNKFVRTIKQRLTPIDGIALVVLVLYAIVWIVRFTGHEPPMSGLVTFFFFLALGYFAIRIGTGARTRVLWSLRNRLIIAYLFIAVVPVVMLLVLGGLSASILYRQLGGYLLVQEVQDRIEEVADAADVVAAGAATVDPAKIAGERSAKTFPSSLETQIATLEDHIPQIEFNLHSDGALLKQESATKSGRFKGLVQSGDTLWIVGEVKRNDVTVRAREPVTPALLERCAPFLGPISVVPTRPAGASDPQQSILHIGDGQYRSQYRVETKLRKLPPSSAWFDFQVDGISKMPSILADSTTHVLTESPVFLNYSARVRSLNAHLFTSLGDLGDVYIQLFLAVLLVFIILEAGSLVTGVVLTRTITRSVGDLYEATQYVRSGDFSHRIRVERADQLGALGESFNAMSSSIDGLVEEQRKRQKLENEVAIAQEVQSQLFPRNLPVLAGIQLGAYCKPARGVSGDYYDFLPLGSTRLGIALADISGKGISAALLMASVQAALRSQLLLNPEAATSAAEVVSRINKHLYLNTAEDRFATFFFAIYDSSTRILRYTNAGHCAPMLINGEKIQRLETGGIVVGVFEDAEYEEGIVEVGPDSVLVVYSDGLIEPENVYGEEFGTNRLENVALRNRRSSADAIVAALLVSAEEWAGTAEQADDMTVIVARLGQSAAASSPGVGSDVTAVNA